jgi:hypothetical protein
MGGPRLYDVLTLAGIPSVRLLFRVAVFEPRPRRSRGKQPRQLRSKELGEFCIGLVVQHTPLRLASAPGPSRRR